MSRYKYRFDNSQTFVNKSFIHGCGSEPTSQQVITYRNYGYTDATRHRVKPRYLLPTSLTYTEATNLSDLGFYPCNRYNCSGSYYEGSYLHTHPIQTKLWSRMKQVSEASKNSARLAASSAFTGDMASFGESLAELTETGKMIYKRAEQVVSIANALKKRNFGRLESILHGELPPSVTRVKKGKELANGWLELEFGWKPLIQDVYAAVDAYRSSIVKGKLVTSLGMKQGYYGPVKSMDVKGAGRYADYIENDMTPRVKSKAYGVVQNPSLFTLNQLGLANPALLAWQLLPFSFVVDWFLPISQILGVMTNRIGLSQYAVCVVSERGSMSMWRCDPVWSGTKYVTRNVFYSVPTDITRVSPRSLGLWHAATATALIRQVFGR